jgi:hypothetical protein
VRIPPSAALLVGVLILTACAGPGGLTGDPGPRCPGGPTQPITSEELLSALSRQGLSLEAEEFSAICSARGIEADLVNDDDRGVLGCSLRRRPIYAHPERLKKEVAVNKVYFRLANVECSIYPDQQNDQRVGALERTLRELQRQL